MADKEPLPSEIFSVIHEWLQLSLAPDATLADVQGKPELVVTVFSKVAKKPFPEGVEQVCAELGVPECVWSAAEQQRERVANDARDHKLAGMWVAALSIAVTEYDSDDTYGGEIATLEEDKQLFLMNLVEPFLEKQNSIVEENAGSGGAANLRIDMEDVSPDLVRMETDDDDSRFAEGGRGASSSSTGRYLHAPLVDGEAGSASSSHGKLQHSGSATASPSSGSGGAAIVGGTCEAGGSSSSTSAAPRSKTLETHSAAAGTAASNHDLTRNSTTSKSVVSGGRTSAHAPDRVINDQQSIAASAAYQQEQEALIVHLRGEIARLKKDTAGRTQAANELMDAEFDASLARHALEQNLKETTEKLKALEERYAALEGLNFSQGEKLLELERLRALSDEAVASRAKIESLKSKLADAVRERDQNAAGRRRADELEQELKAVAADYQKLLDSGKASDALREKNKKTEGTLQELQARITELEQQAQDAREAYEQLKQINTETSNNLRLLQGSKEEEIFSAESRRREALHEQRARFEQDLKNLEEKMRALEKKHSEQTQLLEGSHAREREALKDHLAKKEALLLERKQALLDKDAQCKEEIRGLLKQHADTSDKDKRLTAELEKQRIAALEVLRTETGDRAAAAQQAAELQRAALQAALDAAKDELRSERTARAREIDDLRQSGDATERELIATWTARVEEANDRLEKERQRILEVEQAWEQKWQHECGNLRNQHENLLRSQLHQLETAWVEKERAYKAEAQDLLASAEREFQRVKNDGEGDSKLLTEQITSLKAEMDRTKRDLMAEKEGLIEKQKREVGNMREKSEGVITELKERHGKELESQKKQLESEFGNRSRVELDKVRDSESARLQEMRKQHETDVAELVESIRGLREQVAAKDQQISAAEQEHAAVRDQLIAQQQEQSSGAFATLRAKCEAQKAELKAAKDTSSQLELDLEEVRLRLTCVMESSEKEIAALKAEVRDGREKLAAADERFLESEARLKLQREQAYAAKGSISSMRVLEGLRGRQLADLQQAGIDWQAKYRTLMESYKEISAAYEAEKQEAGVGIGSSSSGGRGHSGDTSSCTKNLLEENVALKKEKKDMVRSLQPRDAAPSAQHLAPPPSSSAQHSQPQPQQLQQVTKLGSPNVKADRVLEEKKLSPNLQLNQYSDPPRGMSTKRELGPHERSDSAEKRLKMAGGGRVPISHATQHQPQGSEDRCNQQ
eukprot:g1392.t1